LVNTDLMIYKAAAAKRHLARIKKKSDIDMGTFLNDLAIQESVLFNMQMAIQNCIDMAAHIISDENLGVAASNNEMFYILEENGYISPELTEKMVKAIGFRNLIVHEYAKLDLRKVFQTTKTDLNDLAEFLKSVFIKANMTL
jgi:uncharacterized protein YutE (UPF0331/DUF86 family)